MDQIELFDKYVDQNHMWSWEGLRGVRLLTQVVNEVCGYTSMDSFLEDNPGAMEAVVNWIREANCLEWRQNLEQLVANETDAE